MDADPILITILTLAPAIILLIFFYLLDRRKESFWPILRVLILGVLISIPVIIIELVYKEYAPNPYLQTWEFILFTSFVVAAFTEETMKLVAFRLGAWNERKFNEYMDGIFYMIVISLAFAGLENFIYGHIYLRGAIIPILMRALLAVPGHAIWSGIMGYFIAKAKFSKTILPWRPFNEYWYIGIFLAIFLHGLYDVFAFATGLVEEIWIWGCIIMVGLGFIVLLALIRHANKLTVENPQ
jgi:RsiW-degrading membrane proteinase PrsW (M82 family)